jgi:hypothetical protein
MPRASAVVALAVLTLAASSASAAKPAPLSFRAFADTGRLLVDVLWTGRQFLYVENTTNAIWAAGAAGAPVTPFANLPPESEETRCRLSTGAHGFAAGIYCHTPGNVIYRIGLQGSPVEVFARLPDTATSDGALDFDTVGKFGYALIAATGRSGAPTPSGGTVYAIGASGAVRTIGTYDGPGGADELAVAPAKFGTGSGQVVLTVDAGPTAGTLVLMDPQGRTRTIARLPDGPNPIAVVKVPRRGTAPVPRGLYITDTFSHTVFLAPAAQLAPYVGSLVVGTESKATFWIVQPNGRGFSTFKVPATIPLTSFNLEGATYVSG